jgi:hypothetical protein
MMGRAIYGLLFDYNLYEPTDKEMGITEDMKGKKSLSDEVQDIFVDFYDDKQESEKPICYDCPSELWCGDCPDSERCSDSIINCRSCPFEEGCLNEVPAGLRELELDFEVTDKPLSDIPNDVESFHGMHGPVEYSDLMPGRVEDHDHGMPLIVEEKSDFDELWDEAHAEPEVIDHPAHYAEADIPSGIECWDWYELAMTEEEFIGHMKGNVLKYVFRAGRKSDGAQDLEKAGAYLKRWLSYLDGDRTVHMKGKKNDG